MSEPTSSSVARSLSWLLAILLVGVVALLLWYHESTQQELTAREDSIARTTLQLTDSQAMLGQAKEKQEALTAEIAALEAQHQKNEAALQAEIAAGAKANSDLQARMQAAEERHAATLAAGALRPRLELGDRPDDAHRQ